MSKEDTVDRKNEVLLEDAARITRLDGNNARFCIKNKFLTLSLVENGEERSCGKVSLHRAFPFELLWEYVSVIGDDGKEIGIIYTLDDFDDGTAAILRTEIERKYYAPVIASIESIKERYGFSSWTVVTDEGKSMSFTMRDTFKNLIKTSEDSAMLIDADGNRFKINSISGLDRKSYRKIELYL